MSDMNSNTRIGMVVVFIFAAVEALVNAEGGPWLLFIGPMMFGMGMLFAGAREAKAKKQTEILTAMKKAATAAAAKP